jgi:hypothetical protein
MSLMDRLRCNLHGGWWLVVVTICFLHLVWGVILEKIFVQDDTQITYVWPALARARAVSLQNQYRARSIVDCLYSF